MTDGHSTSKLLEVLVNIFFFAAVFVGISVYMNPNFFQQIAIAHKSVDQIMKEAGAVTHSAPKELQVSSLEKDILGAIEKFNPRVTFIPVVDDNNKPLELPIVFASSDKTYLHAKAIEFCLERYQDLHLSSFDALEEECVNKVFSSLVQQTAENSTNGFQDILTRTKEREEQVRQEQLKAQAYAVDNIVRIAGTQTNYKIRIPVNNGKFYDISFDLQITPPKKIAQIFCSQKANELQIQTDGLLATCMAQIEDYIIDRVNKIDPNALAHRESKNAPDIVEPVTESEAVSPSDSSSVQPTTTAAEITNSSTGESYPEDTSPQQVE